MNGWDGGLERLSSSPFLSDFSFSHQFVIFLLLSFFSSTYMIILQLCIF